MRRTHKEVQQTEIVILDDIVCNVCAKSLLDKKNPCDPPVVRISHSWGYGSKKDMTCHEVDVCESCWDTWCSTLKIPVRITEYDGTPLPGEENYGPQLSLFPWYELSGDPGLMDGLCKYPSMTKGYAPCTRKICHEGPCAHPLANHSSPSPDSSAD